jgi:hypothetical protein
MQLKSLLTITLTFFIGCTTSRVYVRSYQERPIYFGNPDALNRVAQEQWNCLIKKLILL